MLTLYLALAVLLKSGLAWELKMKWSLPAPFGFAIFIVWTLEERMKKESLDFTTQRCTQRFKIFGSQDE